MNDAARSTLRDLPSVGELVGILFEDDAPRPQERFLVSLARQVLDAAREEALAGDPSAVYSVADRFRDAAAYLTSSHLRSVVNGTGVIVHTNLGRAPVSAATAAEMAAAAGSYLPLEVDLASGERGRRGTEVEILLRVLTGVERAHLVNNNAAGVLLTLNALCTGQRVVVSRGEAVEIGGGFRIPDVMRQSGAEIVEVGTTNRTRLADYEAAIDDSTAAVLTVHASNFEITGFTGKPALRELAELAHSRNIMLIEDVGSGCLVDTEHYGLEHEPTLAESVQAGVDVVMASGDKLLGGPQAGLILGRSALVERIARHPLARAVRVDKSTQAGVATTLRHYLHGTQDAEIPIWWMMSRSKSQLDDRVGVWIDQISERSARQLDTSSVTGGGSLPGKMQPSSGLALEIDGRSASSVARMLRTGVPAVFPRIIEDRAVIDARTVLPDQDRDVVDAVGALLAKL